MINPDTVDKIMDATRVEEVVGEFVMLKKRGVNLQGLCPFHDEKTPSFNVSPTKGIYKCFGCGKGGNAVNFLMEHEHYTYPEALKYLAAKYGIEVEEEKPSPEQQQAMDEKESLFNLSGYAQKYFEKTLHESQEGMAVGLTYLKERELNLETIKKFGLGYCTNQWDAFTRQALQDGYKKEYLLKTSLAKEKDHQLYDTMRGRVIFPIHNLSGRVLGFGARIMTSDKKRPKYINSAESEIYHKGRVLYGLYFAKSAIASLDNCYLVEGYTDVISMHQAGVQNVIASSGTALTTEQIRLISRYTSNITLLFDGDKAGIKAAFRGINMILEQGMNVRLVLFPDGEDPDSYARKYRPAEVKSFIEDNALDFISFKTNLLLEETKNDPIKKAGLIREIAETIALIPEPIARTLYVQQCSGLMQIDEKLLFTEINKLRRKKSLEKSASHSQPEHDILPDLPAGDSSESRAVLQPTLDFQEKDVIRIMLLYGHREVMVEGLNEDDRPVQIALKVVSYIIQDFEEDEMRFENAACQTIFDLCREAAASALPHDDQYLSNLVLNHDNQEVRQLAIDLITSQHTLSHNWEQRHQIFVKTEAEDVKSLMEEVVHSLKLRILEKRIEENQKKMKEEQDHDKIMQLIEIERDLKNLRSACAHQLSLVVTR